jgi:hypothetical protein
MLAEPPICADVVSVSTKTFVVHIRVICAAAVAADSLTCRHAE